MKRGRGGGSLTGGSGDVNPQWLTFFSTQSAADTTTSTQQTLPVQRLPTGGKSQVMEVLRIQFSHSTFPAIASAAEAVDTISGFLSTNNFGTTNAAFSEPRVFAGVRHFLRGAFTAAGTFGTYGSDVEWVDLTDGQGHGFLVATDSIFLQTQSTGTGAVNTVVVKILYRMKNVGLSEYIGIVQGQQ